MSGALRTIIILSRKIPKVNIVEFQNFFDYQIQLTEVAQEFPGFIKSTSYISKDKDEHLKSLTTLSEWTSQSSWDFWLDSEERKIINNKFINIIDLETFETVTKRKDCIKYPLL